MTPFAAMADTSPESFAALGALMSPKDIAVLFTPDAVNSARRNSRLRWRIPASR